MAFLVLGVVLLIAKWADIGPLAALGWGWVLAPFGMAAAWWWWADWSGYTQRKAMQKEQARKAARVQKARAALKPPGSRR